MESEYYYIKPYYEYYFKYTRTLEFFENDELFYKIDYTNFMDFLLAIQGKKNITKILYVGHNYDDIEKLLNFSISLPTNIKIFIIICGDWWYWDFYPESQKFVTKNIFYYDNIKYIVCTDYKTLGSFLNINLDNFQQNIISFDMHSCYDKCIIPFNNSPINKILVSGDCHQDWYPERHYLLKFNNVEKKQRGEDVWISENNYSKYVNNYICSFASSNYPYNLEKSDFKNTHLILLKVYEILGSGSLLLSPLTEKSYYEKIGLYENINCILINMSDDIDIQNKIDFILDIENREFIDRIRLAGQEHGKNNLNSKKKYEILRKLIIEN